MSISQLEVPNSFDLFVNSLTVTESVNVGSNQIFWNTGVVLANNTFIGPTGQVATLPAAQAVTDNPITIKKFRVLLSAAPGAGQIWTFNLYVNNTPTLIANVSDTSISAVSTGSPVTLVAGNTFAISATSTPSAVAGFATFCLDYQ
jgi:hypothetical protein